MPVSKASANAITPAAKGAIAIGSGTNAAGVLAAGTNNYVLTADSAETLGVKWAAVAASSFVGCRIRKTGTQNISNNTYTALDFNDTDDFDTDAFHNPSSFNSRITIPSGKAGKYLIIGNWTTGTDPTNQRRIFIYKNGSQQGGSVQVNAALNDGTGLLISMILDLAVGDYVETYVWQNSGQTIGTNAANTTMMAQFLGA